MTTSPSWPRRAGRRLRRIPLLGPLARDAYASVEAQLWQRVLTPLRHRRLAAEGRLQDARNRRARTAANITRRNTRAAYERLYSDERLLNEYLAPDRLAFYETVAALAASMGPQSVADVGCGTGHLLRSLLDRVPVTHVLGVDHARSAIERARQVVPEAELVVADLAGFRPQQRYELVLCTEVLEHLEDPVAARKTLGRLAAAGGHVLVTVPDGATDTWEGHVNFWSAPELEQFLAPLGTVETRLLGGDLLAVVSVP